VPFGRRWLVVGCTVLTACAGEAPVTTNGVTDTVTAPSSAEAPNSLPSEMAGDGTFRIGTDIGPGTWHTDGPRTHNAQHYNNGQVGAVPPSPCTWAIGHVASIGGQENFVTNDGGPPKAEWGPRDVVITATGADFITSSCRTWRLVKPG